MYLQRNQLSPTLKREFQNLSKRFPQLSELREAAGEQNAERVHLTSEDMYRDNGTWEIPSWGYPSPAGRFTGTIDWRKKSGQLDGVRIREIDGKLEGGSKFNLRPSGNYFAGTAGTASQAWGPHKDLPGIPTGEYSIWQAKMDSEEEAKLINLNVYGGNDVHYRFSAGQDSAKLGRPIDKETYVVRFPAASPQTAAQKEIANDVHEVKSFFEGLKSAAKAAIEESQSPLSPGEKRGLYIDVEGLGPMRGSMTVSKDNSDEIQSFHLGTHDRTRSFSYLESETSGLEAYTLSDNNFVESFSIRNKSSTDKSVVQYEAVVRPEQPYMAALT